MLSLGLIISKFYQRNYLSVFGEVITARVTKSNLLTYKLTPTDSWLKVQYSLVLPQCYLRNILEILQVNHDWEE